MSPPLSWDVFCRVVDNLGDVGVCWRLARQLASQYNGPVRLWVDNLAALRMLSPEADAGRNRQQVENVEVCRWVEPFPAARPPDVVIEAFGCGLPEPYVAAMAGRNPKSLWITLEYLSAESWVRDYHGRASPHPQWPVPHYFFFPGFDSGTGGVLREPDLLLRRNAFGDAGRRKFWSSIGFEPPAREVIVVSLFAYDDAPAADLLSAWHDSDRPTIVAVPEGTSVAAILAFVNVGPAAAGQRFVRDRLEVRIVPFVPQPRYDELLWACNCNFVRGEDSFVRAQWAGRPFIWQIYRQRDDAHRPKLEAFLDRYCAGLPPQAAEATRRLWREWNSACASPVGISASWRAFWDQRAALESHSMAWADRLGAGGELAEELARFCADKLKY